MSLLSRYFKSRAERKNLEFLEISFCNAHSVSEKSITAKFLNENACLISETDTKKVETSLSLPFLMSVDANKDPLRKETTSNWFSKQGYLSSSKT